MKNDPVVTYNHMEEENASGGAQDVNVTNERQNHPISLYMILVVDLILIGAVAYLATRLIF